MGVSLEVWGPYACFSRPEFKSERVSYDVMTPAAARGILESILYKPAIRWVIDRITVYNPIKTVNVKRVERSEIDKRPDFKKVVDSGKKALRNTNALKDVHYRIDAHFEYTDEKGDRDNDGKFLEMFNHRARTGRCFKQPSLGCREFPAFFKLPDPENIPEVDKSLQGSRDLSFMHYDFDYSQGKKKPLYFHAILKDGVLDLSDVKVIS